MAPERLAEGFVDPATDVYALGLLLYRCIAGRLPWSTSTITQILSNHRYVTPQPLPPVAVPAPLAEICERCLAKEPAERPTAGEVGRVLGEIAGLPPGTLPLPGAMDAVIAGDRASGQPPARSTGTSDPGRHRGTQPMNPNGRASRAAASIAAILDSTP
jgi:serine/threonine-protein kinase